MFDKDSLLIVSIGGSLKTEYTLMAKNLSILTFFLENPRAKWPHPGGDYIKGRMLEGEFTG
jgi:hypothetical protein